MEDVEAGCRRYRSIILLFSNDVMPSNFPWRPMSKYAEAQRCVRDWHVARQVCSLDCRLQTTRSRLLLDHALGPLFVPYDEKVHHSFLDIPIAGVLGIQ